MQVAFGVARQRDQTLILGLWTEYDRPMSDVQAATTQRLAPHKTYHTKRTLGTELSLCCSTPQEAYTCTVSSTNMDHAGGNELKAPSFFTRLFESLRVVCYFPGLLLAVQLVHTT